jgi:hypothetical protein
MGRLCNCDREIGNNCPGQTRCADANLVRGAKGVPSYFNN